MTSFVKPPREYRRSPAVHDRDCDRPGWAVQERIRPDLPVLACCRGCTAVRKVTTP